MPRPDVLFVVPKLLGDAGRVRWIREEGELVEAGKHVVELDLGYDVARLPAPATGRIRQKLAAEGEQVHDGADLALLDVNVTGRVPIELCASCGVVRLDRARGCKHCHALHGPQALPAPRDGRPMWACVECSFKCRACGFVVPLGRLDLDGTVECARCGLQQEFPVKPWHDAFDHAHAAADDMVEGLGKQQVSSQATIAEATSFEITASPGHPLCPGCHGLLDVAPGEGGRATASCAACKTSETYALPPAAARMMSGSLVAVVAIEHRADRAAARVEKTAEAIAVHCPSCNAALDVSDAGTRVARCRYCGTTAVVPAGVWFQLRSKDAPPEPIWLAREAEARKARQSLEGTVQRLRHAKSGPPPAKHAQQSAPAPAPARTEARAKQTAPAPPAAKGTRVVVVVLALVVLAAVGVTVALAR